MLLRIQMVIDLVRALYRRDGSKEWKTRAWFSLAFLWHCLARCLWTRAPSLPSMAWHWCLRGDTGVLCTQQCPTGHCPWVRRKEEGGCMSGNSRNRAVMWWCWLNINAGHLCSSFSPHTESKQLVQSISESWKCSSHLLLLNRQKLAELLRPSLWLE